MLKNDTVIGRFAVRFCLVLLVSLFISELGSSISLTKRLYSKAFYVEYFSTVIIACLITELVYRVSTYLDRKYTWFDNVVLRLVMQSLYAVIIPSGLVLLLAVIYFYLNGYNLFRTDYIYFAFPLIIVLIVMMNLIFVTVPYFMFAFKKLGNNTNGEFTQWNTTTEINTKPYYKQVMAHSGASVVPIPENEIASFYIIEGKVLIKNFAGAELLTDATLDDLENNLDPYQFFRVNRQLIANRTACKNYTLLDYGKLAVSILPIPAVNTVVSQRKALVFKEWFTLE